MTAGTSFDSVTDSMRIAVILQDFEKPGGVQSVAVALAHELRQSGHFVDFINIASSSRDELSRRLFWPPSWVGRPHISRRPGRSDVIDVGTSLAEFEFARYLPRPALTRLLDSYDGLLGVMGAPALGIVSSRSKRPFVMQVATRAQWERAATSEPLLIRRLVRQAITRVVSIQERAALRLASAVIVENPVMRDEALRLAPHTPIHLVPPGVDTAKFTPIGPWSPRGPLVSICRLTDSRKALHRIIDAYGILMRMDPDAPPLILAGRGPVPSKLQEQVAALNLADRVTFDIDLSEERIVALLQKASVFVQSSTEEGLGMAAIEAMASGLPVVATRTAGSEVVVVDRTTGVLVDQTDDVSLHLAEGIREALAMGASWGSLGRERATQMFSNFELGSLVVDLISTNRVGSVHG